MSPRRTSPTSRSTSPYPSRASPQAKPRKREQFSACGACRMRRVRCDLKDLPLTTSGQHLPCSNCRERGLKCVDEFAEVKAVKLLRRGRRLQQVEALYGKSATGASSIHITTPPPSVIPKLKPEFFHSKFFRRFHIQRPILEPTEFRERYERFIGGDPNALQVPGQLIAMVLVVWAATFGVDETGREEPNDDGSEESQSRSERVHEMLQEMLYLVDIHGVLRQPCWDGVRLLLLLLPLTQEVQTPMERLVMHEATLSQIHTLCTLAPHSSPTHHGEYTDALVKARIFWYAYVLDGVTSGLRGGRLLFTEDDLSVFHSKLPSARGGSSKAALMFTFTQRFASVPIRISTLCRIVHGFLTGPKARHGEELKEETLQSVWDSLDQCWKELDELRRLGSGGGLDEEEVERYIYSWQIFIFECHNVIRETLKQRLVTHPLPDTSISDVSPEPARRYYALSRLYDAAKFRCNDAVRNVVSIIQHNLGGPLFQYDAAVVRDGCFYAGFLLAGESYLQEEVEICLRSLEEMKFSFSRSSERVQTVKMLWESRSNRGHEGRSFSSSPSLHGLSDSRRHSPSDLSPSIKRSSTRCVSVPTLTFLSLPPSLSVGSASAPTTAYPDDSSWPSSISPHEDQFLHAHDSPIQSTHSTPPFLHMRPPTSGHPFVPGAGLVSFGSSASQDFYMQQYCPPFIDPDVPKSGSASSAGSPDHPTSSSYHTSQFIEGSSLAYPSQPLGQHPNGISMHLSSAETDRDDDTLAKLSSYYR
ncbi:hypothetical protein ABKN59_003372 [Abortiporus biennis]